MSTEVEQDRALRTRFGVTAILVGVLAITNGVWGLVSTRSRNAENEALSQANAEIDSRLADAKAILDEVKQLSLQADELNERAAKIEVTLSNPSSSK